VGRFKKFDASYLALTAPENGIVAEIPSNRYLPQRAVPVTEHLIQLLWRNGLYHKNGMRTTNGLPIRILKPGRFNRSSGPDFKNAEIVVGEKKIVGDVEIHINAAEWYRHNHHLSPRYNRTVLHVFLHRYEDTRPAATRSGRVVPELELSLYLRHPLEELRIEVEDSERPVTGRGNIPPCRDMLLSEGLQSVYGLLDKVGDGRMLIKSNRFMERLEAAPADQILYEIYFECLGYSLFKEQFGRMARYVTLDELRKLILLNSGRKTELTAQGVFFMVSGLSDTARRTSEDVELKKLLSRLDSLEYGGLERIFSQKEWQLTGCRPVNYPHRRIAAFSHLVTGKFSADYYRAIINSLQPAMTDRACRKFIQRLLDTFSGISDSFWSSRYTFNSASRMPKKLIGRDRAISLVVDCLIPFFLAISRKEDNPELEHKLAAIYISVPKPSSNAVVDFMIKQFFGKQSRSFIKSVRHQQALIQLYNDFCFMAPGGCTGCHFLEYLKIASHAPGEHS
jgi:hypothetical protein